MDDFVATMVTYYWWLTNIFILFSGSTGKPKGVLHTVGGYMLYTATTFKYSFDYHPGDIYFCTADIGWITGHSYVTYGPLLNNATSVLVSNFSFIFFTIEAEADSSKNFWMSL